MKVYIVTSGIYSSYEIEAVFSTEDLAKKYLDIHGDYNDRKIEEWDLDSENLTIEKRAYYVQIDKENTIADLKERSFETETVCYSKCNNGTYIFCLNAEGAERAKKIASERLMQVKAMPYLFPRLEEQCVGFNYSYHTTWKYPTYDFHTKKIILNKDEFLK